MRRIFRWLGYLAAATCGLATLAVAGLWLQSYFWTDYFEYWGYIAAQMHEEEVPKIGRKAQIGPTYDLWILSNNGELIIEGSTSLGTGEGPTGWYHGRRSGTLPMSGEWEFSRESAADNRSFRLDCRYWAVLLPLLLVDTWLVRRGVVRWRRGRLVGCCEKCGYNLTANVSGICPECGTLVPAAPLGGVRP